jgi:hypothetical protein
VRKLIALDICEKKERDRRGKRWEGRSGRRVDQINAEFREKRDILNVHCTVTDITPN